MTPALIKTAADEAGLTNVSLPSCDVANKSIDIGLRGALLRGVHADPRTGVLGRPRRNSQMGRDAAADGSPKGTNDATTALLADGKPVANAARNTWVTETALATALNMGYMAEQLAPSRS